MMTHATATAPLFFAPVAGTEQVEVDLARGQDIAAHVVQSAVAQCREALRADADCISVTMDFNADGVPVDWHEQASSIAVTVYR